MPDLTNLLTMIYYPKTPNFSVTIESVIVLHGIQTPEYRMLSRYPPTYGTFFKQEYQENKNPFLYDQVR